MAALNAKKLRPAGEGRKVERRTVSQSRYNRHCVYGYNPATAYKPRPLAFIKLCFY